MNRNERAVDDELSLNELQLHLSNQAATLRMDMASEYEELRMFQNKELETMLKVKVNKEPEFSKLVTELAIHGNRSRSATHSLPPPPLKPRTTPRPNISSTSSSHSAIVPQISPAIDFPDLTSLKNDPSLSKFIKFFLDLEVVQQNWSAISRNWNQYVFIFQRKLMTETAFAKAILEDAVRTKNNTKFPVNPSDIEITEAMLEDIPETLHMTHVITKAVLEMAEAGDIEVAPTSETKETTSAPAIMMNVIDLEQKMRMQEEDVSGGVRKATDPRQRG